MKWQIHKVENVAGQDVFTIIQFCGLGMDWESVLSRIKSYRNHQKQQSKFTTNEVHRFNLWSKFNQGLWHTPSQVRLGSQQSIQYNASK